MKNSSVETRTVRSCVSVKRTPLEREIAMFANLYVLYEFKDPILAHIRDGDSRSAQRYVYFETIPLAV